MGALPRGRDERALEVEPERLGAVGRGVRHPGADAIGEGVEVGQRGRPGRRQERRDAVAEEGAGHPVEIGRVGPSRRGRPSRGRGRRRSPGRATAARRPAASRRRRWTLDPAIHRPRSRRARRRPVVEDQPAASSAWPSAVSPFVGPGPVGAAPRRTTRRARSGRPDSAIPVASMRRPSSSRITRRSTSSGSPRRMSSSRASSAVALAAPTVPVPRRRLIPPAWIAAWSEPASRSAASTEGPQAWTRTADSRAIGWLSARRTRRTSTIGSPTGSSREAASARVDGRMARARSRDDGT